MPEPLRLDLPREELAFSPGVIPALYQIVEDLVKPDHGKVLTMTPAYGFFLHACEYNGVELVTSPLRKVEGWFEMDWEDFRRKVAAPDVCVPLRHAVGALAQMRVLQMRSSSVTTLAASTSALHPFSGEGGLGERPAGFLLLGALLL